MENKLEEEMIIACWLRGDRHDTINLFELEDFVMYRDIVRAIMQRHKEKLPITLFDIATDSGVKTAVLAQMLTVAEIDFYGCGIMLKRKRMNRIATMNLMYTKESDRAIELQEMFKRKLEGASLNKVNQCVEYLEELDRRSLTDPVLTGLKGLDNMLGGLRQGELTTIAARPAVGKSAFCLQIAENAAKQGKKVLFFALEMSRFELLNRCVTRWTTIESSRLRRGSKAFTDKDAQEMSVVLDSTMKNFTDHVWVETAISNIDMYKSIIEQEKPDLVIIDQLSCLRGTQSMQIREKYCYCTTTLKRISVETNVPILLAAQLSRSAEVKKPTTADIKESSSVEEDSDNVILLWRRDEEDLPQRTIACELVKHRQGETGVLELTYVCNKTKFYEVQR